MFSILFLFFQEYFKLRSKAVSALKETAEHPYPHKFHVEISLTEFIEKFSNLNVGQTLDDVVVTVAGIIYCLPKRKSYFTDVCSCTALISLSAVKSYLPV